jgi:hypothetical protein
MIMCARLPTSCIHLTVLDVRHSNVSCAIVFKLPVLKIMGAACVSTTKTTALEQRQERPSLKTRAMGIKAQPKRHEKAAIAPQRNSSHSFCLFDLPFRLRVPVSFLPKCVLRVP